MATAVVELNQQRSESSLASKPTRSHAQVIDSIPLDNPSGEREVVAIKCNHFSIRGYVAELRKRDPKLCDPFSMHRIHDGSFETIHELPPMVVPQFRWWNCDGCIPASSSPTGIGQQLAHYSADGEKYPLKQLMVKTSNIESPQERNAEATSNSSDSQVNRNYSPLAVCAPDRKRKGKTHVEDGRPVAPQKVGLGSGCQVDAIIKYHQDNISNDIETDAPENSNRATSDDGDENEVVPVFGNNNIYDKEDDYLGIDRRKTPKVRLLSELLGLKNTQNDAKLNKRHSPSFSDSRDSDALKSGLSESQTVKENAKRKRVDSHEDLRYMEVKGLNDGNKKHTSPYAEVSESEPDDESTEMISKVLVKRCSKYALYKKPLLEKRNNKKIKSDDGGSSLMSLPHITPKSSNGKGKPSETNLVSTNEEVIALPRKGDDSANLNGKRSSLAKRKGNMVQDEKVLTSLRECTPFRNNKEAIQESTEHVQNYLSQGSSHIHHFPDRYMWTGNDQMHATPGKNGFRVLASPIEPLASDHRVIRKHNVNTSIKETSLGFKTSTGTPVTESQFNGTRERSIGLKMNSKGERSRIPEAEVGSPLLQHSAIQVSSSVVDRKEMSRRIQDIDINSIPSDDKVPEHGTGDDGHDIPMDIVELMAKNQYERNLSDPRDKHFPVSLSENIRSNGTTSTYREQMPKLKPPYVLNWQNSLPQDARNGMSSNGFEATNSFKHSLLGPFSDLNRTHLSFRGHLTENQVSAKSHTLDQRQGPYSAFSFTANNGSGHTGAQQRCPPDFLQTMESYNTCRPSSSPQPNTEACVWPSVMATNKGKSLPQGPSILSFSAAKQNMNFSNAYYGSKQKGGCRPLKPRGSVDLCSNEVIPAMHLLSLMQNAAKMRSAPGIPTDAGRSSIFPDHQPYKQHHGNQELRHSLLENNRTSTMKESSCHPCYPVLPPVHSFPSSFSSDGGTGRKPGFLTPIPLTSSGQRNIESSHFTAHGGVLRPPKPISYILGHKRNMGSGLDKGKGITGMSGPPSFTNPHQGTKDSINCTFELATRHGEMTVYPSHQEEICMVNRNPSEFNDLKFLRRYMINPEDLRPRETRHEKSARRRIAKKQEGRMNKHIPGLIRKITGEVS